MEARLVRRGWCAKHPHKRLWGQLEGIRSRGLHLKRCWLLLRRRRRLEGVVSGEASRKWVVLLVLRKDSDLVLSGVDWVVVVDRVIMLAGVLGALLGGRG